MNAVVAGGPGLVAVGRDRGLGSAAVWVSEDGRDWERVEHDEAVFDDDGPQVMVDASVAEEGVVAVGDDRGTDGNGAVWRSEDGRNWERLDDEEEFGGPGAQFVTSVTPGGPGLVAVGHDFGASSPAVWVSEDGRSWDRTVQQATDIVGPAGGLMNAVTDTHAGLVAVGQDSGVAAVWVSEDAELWHRLGNEEEVFDGDGEQRMAGVTTFGEALIAVGADEAAGQAAVWRAE